MNMQDLGVGVSLGVALITGNAVVMKFVIRAAITESMLSIHDKFVTKEHLDDHFKNCPHQFRSK